MVYSRRRCFILGVVVIVRRVQECLSRARSDQQRRTKHPFTNNIIAALLAICFLSLSLRAKGMTDAQKQQRSSSSIVKKERRPREAARRFVHDRSALRSVRRRRM
jgi:hypothetical protein